jgi:HlyD family secretion protein
MKTALWWIIILAALTTGTWYGYPLLMPKQAPTQYQTVVLKQQNIVQAVTATGQLSALVTVEVGSQISGKISELMADFNSPVKAGQIVAELDPATYVAIKMQMEGEVANARATLQLARLQQKRMTDLVAGEAAPQADLDKAIADLSQAEAMLQIKEGQLQKASVDLDRCTITAPVDGVVISRDVNVGQTVQAAMQAPKLFTIANDLKKMQIEAHVSEADIGGLNEGQRAEFTVDAFPSRTFTGIVRMVRYAPVTVENVVSYVTVVEVENPKLELRPGMTANVSIVLDKRDQAIALPNAALRYKPQDSSKPGPPPVETAPAPRKHVYVLRTGEPQRVDIELGLSDGVFTEVIKGASVGQEVITSQYTPGGAGGSMSLNPFGSGPPKR